MERQQVVLNIDAEMLARYDFTFLINADGAKLGTLHVSRKVAQWQAMQAESISLPAPDINIATCALEEEEEDDERKVSIMCLGKARFEIAQTGEIFEVTPEQLSWMCESTVDLKLDPSHCHTAHFCFRSPSTRQEVHVAWKIWESAAGLEYKRKTEKDDSITLLQNFLFGLTR